MQTLTDDRETIRATLNLLDMASQAGADLKYQYGEWRSACPLHKGDNKSAFAIFEREGRLSWQCFTSDCNQRGGGHDEFAFLMALTGRTFAEVMNDLRKGEKPIEQPAKELTPEEIARRLAELERKQNDQERRLQELESWKRRKPWQSYHDQLDTITWARTEWRRAGIPDDWQNFYRLGATDTFQYACSNTLYTSPTLTIPVWGREWQCLTVKHRLLTPHDPKDKYRPDLSGLGNHPFICDPDLKPDAPDLTLIVEGEKKAMVTFLTMDKPLVQVIGLPGKSTRAPEELKGQPVVIIMDPDAGKEARQMAHDLGGARVVNFNHKLDDTIVQYRLGRDWLESLIDNGRYMK